MNSNLTQKPRLGDNACTTHLTAIGDALYAIGGKWKLQIIVALQEGKSRFNELQRLIRGISSKVLAAELRELELNGFVKRTVQSGPPVLIEYELTAYSATLHEVLRTLGEWGVMHRQTVMQTDSTVGLP